MPGRAAPRRTLARQFLGWQLGIVALLLAAVAALAVAQSDAAFRETQGRRMLSVAEDVAATAALRQSLQVGEYGVLPGIATTARNLSGADEIAVADADLVVRTAADPADVGRPFDLGASTAATGRSWVGHPDGRTVVAQVPVLADDGAVVGIVEARVAAPPLLTGLAGAPGRTAALLGLALVVGVVGSLLLARRVRRQTLGLEPAEIVELVQRREAMLLGVKEGVVGMDAAHRVTLLNGAARELLDLPADTGDAMPELDGLDDRLRDVLTGASAGEDQVVLRGARVLVLNRMPVVVDGAEVGAVVTLRDRTELATLQGRLDASKHVTDTLRAQTHEFANRLHTIAGLTELGEHDEVRRFVAGVVAESDQWRREVTERVGDAAGAALLVAKASLATERGVALRLAPGTRLAPARRDPAFSADLVTVLGNLVDNAIDAAGTGGDVEVGLTDDPDDGGVRLTVRDSGPGVASDLAEEVFRHGFTTKAAEEPGGRGLGLALARQACLRRGGTIAVHNEDGAVFTAVLPCAEGVA
ncbi:Spo0B domain-containing protein [Pseudonocardia sp. KRD-184]|uniref:histidine kinase n=1 Tax=Pseudonocardia oceani TaxID=2792013 RepID=A0ABS6UCV5_9PSEU|nr:ATP-binding protein [Pseudonocardia oceani]MBW0089937.1 Spo0B domain-containing protein [Pseudonocardia oceani]MBW0094401.1 Spo0B domain-containing protein [Pseudonocardia oceani]MBW0107914.1 Spo0B domain-containing protein [Pseudonocardia oceani]MBW0119992.1 Spo0B domain-containing protein [Pseudonocardia oceani]MBW0130072.1 Spo0B domain-containing protein [Pseudonocardia oceani]